MKKLIFTLFFLCMTTLVFARPGLDQFAGKYQLVDSQGKIELLINSKNEAKIITAGKDHDYQGVNFSVHRVKSHLGPEPLPIGILSLVYGSDEETYECIVRLAYNLSGDSSETSELCIVDKIVTGNDGPNEVTSVSVPAKTGFVISKWDTKTKEYKKLVDF